MGTERLVEEVRHIRFRTGRDANGLDPVRFHSPETLLDHGCAKSPPAIGTMSAQRFNVCSVFLGGFVPADTVSHVLARWRHHSGTMVARELPGIRATISLRKLRITPQARALAPK
jgi:hypothetical protein